jgi:hypothetical protein
MATHAVYDPSGPPAQGDELAIERSRRLVVAQRDVLGVELVQPDLLEQDGLDVVALGIVGAQDARLLPDAQPRTYRCGLCNMG